MSAPHAPRAPRREIAAIDVSRLPHFAFGYRSSMTWGTTAFMLIEGSTLAILAFAFFYLRRNFGAWPPPRTPMPSLAVGTASLAVQLLSLVPTAIVLRASLRENLPLLRLAKVFMSLAGLAMVAMRALEMAHLNTRWDEHAYGSLIWAIVFTHGTLILVDAIEGIVETTLVWRGPIERRHFADFEDGAYYAMFSVFVWIPFYVLVYLYPRWS
jgi:heme/copper-type cytochrome/quinol oxidase subunit 3